MVQEKGFGVIIAAAGTATALPGVISAYTSLPVPGVSLNGSVEFSISLTAVSFRLHNN